MALPIDKLGTITDPVVSVIDPDRAKAYAAATNDDNPAYTSGKYAPPVFAVVPTWDAMLQSVIGVVPAEAAMMIVHGEQDMHFHQPLVPGRSISTVAQPYSVRVGGTGTRCTIKVEATDAADGAPVLTEYVTMFIRGMSDGEDGGPDKPDHTFPESVGAAGSPLTTVSIQVDDDQTFRYRDASGDQMPIHLDDEFAKSVGLPGIIAHGLCTMAMTSQAIISSVADGDPARLCRLAVRFSKNVFPGNDVITTIYDAGPSDGPSGRRLYPFEAHSAGQLVIANGLAEIAA
jgi:acyl dehydratase